MMRRKIRLLAFAVLIIPVSVFGQVRLPKLVSDGMVLQRNAEVPIWGWAKPGENISIIFRGANYHTVTNADGKWKLILSDLHAGGPFKMMIIGNNTAITLHNVLVGDVWISSGQSNMEHTMYSFREVYQNEIDNAHYDEIHYFDVPHNYSFEGPKQQLPGGEWVSTNPRTVGSFSAAAYFFAKYIYEKYHIPIGIINASVGGSPAQAWISQNALKGKFPDYYQESQQFKDSAYVAKVQRNDRERAQDWYQELQEKDVGYDNSHKPWTAPDVNTDDWQTMKIPGYWADTHLGDVNGSVWFRTKVDVPASMVGKPAMIRLGRIVDADSVFINGTFVGSTSYQYPRRRYHIPAGVLKEGTNTIVTRVINVGGRGGFVPDKPYDISAGGQWINLKKKWKFHLGIKMDPLASQTFVRWKSSGLYNAMIAPMQNYHIKGVIWYQGESNTAKPEEYHELFSTMIKNWREQWHEGDFPFIYVQLPNFLKAKKKPSESNWARLRDSQRETLSLSNTGMAVTIDIGEWNDIHPFDKKDVGKRLALAAEKVAYGEDDIVYSGPSCQSMEKEGKKVILTFSHTGSGMKAKGDDELEGFAIAGPDHHFVWANAKIDGNKVIVWSDKVPNPVAVRYAWADNPNKANLFNNAGLPASPFRTDDWQHIKN